MDKNDKCLSNFEQITLLSVPKIAQNEFKWAYS